MPSLVERIAAMFQAPSSGDPFGRDPKLVRQLLPVFEVVNLYFGTEIRGWENLPEHGPFLVVGNHSGGLETNDAAFFATRWVRERGPDAPLYGLAYDLLFAYPGVGSLLRRLGIVPASHDNGQRALAMGAPLVVFPGGDYEVFRPWSERNRIRFGRHMGFVKLALETGVPVVPMTIHGAHQSTFVLTRGRWIARLTGIDRLHINVFPFVWNIPLGLTPAFVPSIVLPSKVTVQIGAPLDWSRHGPARADDPVVLRACYDEITGIMQADLDALARERPYPVIERLRELVRLPWPLVGPDA